MATAAGAINFGVIYPGGRSPAEGSMAGFTAVGGIDVAAVFARGGAAIVAA